MATSKYVLYITSLVTLLSCFLPSATSGQESDERFTEQSIYIPYDKLQETFEKEGRGVFVPYEQFQKLWKAARDRHRRPEPELAPVRAMITQIENTARVKEEVVRVNSRLKIDLLDEGWIKVPLRLPQSAIISAELDGKFARIVSSDETGHELLLKKETGQPEQVTLTMEYARSFTKAPGQNRVAFQPPMAPVNRWEVRVPEAGVKVKMHPMLAATQLNGSSIGEAEDGDSGERDEPEGSKPGDDAIPTTSETVYLAFVGAAPDVRIEWTPRSEGASGLQALVSVQTEQQVTIDEGAMRTRSRLIYEISRAELATLQIQVPQDQKVVNVVDANLRQWQVTESDNVQTITLRLFEPARQSQQVTIELEKFREDEPLSELRIPVVRALGVGRQRGRVAVNVADSLRAEAVRRSGLLQLDTAEVPSTMAGSQPQFAYRYAALPFDLALRVEQVQPQIRVEQLVHARLVPQKLTVELLVLYDIQRSGVFDFLIDLPPDFEVRAVQGHAQQGVQPLSVESHAVTGEAQRQLAINLSSRALGRVGLRVLLERPLEDANLLTPTGESSQFRFTLPRATGRQIIQQRGTVVVSAPESLRLSAGEVEGLRNVSVDEAFSTVDTSGLAKSSGMSPALSYAFSEGKTQLEFTVQRRQPLITARQLLVARIDPGAVRYEATFQFDVRYSGVKSLRLDVPADIAGSIRNETPQLQESPLSVAPDDLPAGYVAWQITGDAELLGSHTLKLSWESPLRDLGIGKSVELPVPRLSARGVARTEGQIVLIKAETIDLVPQGTPTGLDPIDPQRDLTGWPAIPDAAVALEFHDDDWQLVLNATRYQLEGMKQTSIERAVVRVVVTRSDRLAVQALYRMRSNQQRLEIQLPAEVAEGQVEFDTEPLRIDGRAVSLERGADKKTFYVPLVGHATNEPFLLELRYTAAGTSRRIGYPTFPDEPAVQEVKMIVYLPPERAYLGHRGPWTPELSRPWPWFAPSRQPRLHAESLISRLHAGVTIAGNPATEFPVDGEPILFSTLRPDPPATGALRITTLHRNWLAGFTLAGFLLLGILLLARPLFERLAAVCGLISALVLLGVFTPALAGQLVGQPLLVAAALVGLLWLAVCLAHGVSNLRAWQANSRRRRRRKMPKPKPDSTGTPESAGEPAATGSDPTGDEPTPKSRGDDDV